MTRLTSGRLVLSSSARTHVGLVRTINEDRLLNRIDKGLFAIADGMGGHCRGDAAAEAVINALAQLANRSDKITADQLGLAVSDANLTIYGFDSAAAGQSGSTVAGLLLAPDEAIIFWAGDSRVYRLRHAELQMMTHDHRIVQELIDAGVLTETSARDHPRASVITRAVGAQSILTLAVAIDRPQGGDVYLLCSDGLSDLIDCHAIRDLLERPYIQAAEALLHAALSAGGRDNISLIVVNVEGSFADEEALHCPPISQASGQ